MWSLSHQHRVKMGWYYSLMLQNKPLFICTLLMCKQVGTELSCGLEPKSRTSATVFSTSCLIQLWIIGLGLGRKSWLATLVLKMTFTHSLRFVKKNHRPLIDFFFNLMSSHVNWDRFILPVPKLNHVRSVFCWLFEDRFIVVVNGMSFAKRLCW